MRIPATAWVAVTVATVVMAAALGYGMTAGSLRTEGGEIMGMPWGVVTLVEVYVGMTLFACWMFWREASRVKAAAWLLAAIVLGNIVSCAYVLVALRGARGDARRFWLGYRASKERMQ